MKPRYTRSSRVRAALGASSARVTATDDGIVASTSASLATSPSAPVKRCPSNWVDVSRFCCASCTSIARFAWYA